MNQQKEHRRLAAWFSYHFCRAFHIKSAQVTLISHLLAQRTSWFKESESCSVMCDSLRPHGLYSPVNFLGQNTGVGSLSLLQGVFPTQELNAGLPHCRRIPYQLSYKGSLSWFKEYENTWSFSVFSAIFINEHHLSEFQNLRISCFLKLMTLMSCFWCLRNFFGLCPLLSNSSTTLWLSLPFYLPWPPAGHPACMAILITAHLLFRIHSGFCLL